MKSHVISLNAISTERIRVASTLVLATAALLSLASCSGHVTSIKDLMTDPSSYDGKPVQVEGTVTSNVGALGFGAYQVDDGTGTITVVTTTGGAPKEGAKVAIEGKFRSGFTLGDKSAAVIMEDNRKLR
jgi:DNA/RNA endonuclease YhcR with UshA esterase domain